MPTFFTTNLETLKKNKKSCLAVALLFFCLLAALGFLCRELAHTEKTLEEKQDEIHVMTEDHARDINALQNELNISRQNAVAARQEILEAQQGGKAPTVIYKELPKNGAPLVEVIKEKLEKKDTTLPPEALAKTDKTVIAEQPENKEIPVGIYKINTYRNWEIGTGLGVHEGKPYIPLSIQRNYKKDRSIAVEVHYGLQSRQIDGAELQWKVHF